MIFAQVVLPPTPSVGDRVPDVIFRQPDGKPFRLASLKGKIVVIEFSTLACPPCRIIAPKLEEMAAKNPDVVFLTICVDTPSAAAELLRMRPKDAKTKFLIDPLQSDRSKMATYAFGDPGYPGTFVIARDQTFASHLILGTEDLSRLQSRITWAQKRP